MSLAKIGFGGGCHWCTEGVFSVIKGVVEIDQSWISSTPPREAYSEAIMVLYNTNEIRLTNLIQIHLHTHACTSDHSMRGKYRSAIYTFNQVDIVKSTNALKQFSTHFENPIITRVLPFSSFKASTDTYQDHYQKNPDKPFCQTYIDPKIQLLKRKFSGLLR